MKKVGILGLMAWIIVVALAWNVSLAECEPNWIFYDTWANVTYIDTNGKSFTWIGTITVCYSWEEITLLDRNLGATTNDINSWDSYGYYFQWGNDYGFPSSGDVKVFTAQVEAISPYSSGVFILDKNSWMSGVNKFWGENTGVNVEKRWPCPDGYHVPTIWEWKYLYNYFLANESGESLSTLFSELFKLPLAWYRGRKDAKTGSQNVYGNYWSSSTSGDSVYSVYFGEWKIIPDSLTNWKKTSGFSVRCFANQTYIVSFETNGWSNVISLTGLEWTKIKAPETPIRMWYSFSGWYLSGTDVERDFNTNVITWNIVLYAKWNKLELDDWLILYYTFDGDSVAWDKVIDQSSQNNTWISNGWVKFNGWGSAEFNGTWVITFNDYWNLIRETNAWTVSLRINSQTNKNQIIIWSSYWPALWFYNNKYFIGFSDEKATRRPYWIISGLNMWEWNNIVVILSWNDIFYYLNGNGLVNSGGTNYWAWDWESAIGSRIGTTYDKNYFSWYLDEVRVYNRVLSEEEIQTLYASWFNAWNIECSISYARNLENSGYVDVTLNCPVDVRVTSGWKSSNYTFTESGSYIFEFDYWWNTGSKVANVSWYNIQFVAWDNWTLSWNTEYNVLVRDDESNFESLGINIPEPIANSGYIFNWWLETSPTSWTIVNRNLVFTAQFKETEKSYSDLDEPKVSWWWSWWWGHRAVSDKSSDRGSDFNGEVEITYEDEYSLEMNEAYQFAFENWITTKDTINDADMDWVLTRVAMAKMLSQYAINVLWKAPANLIVPKFVDVTDEMNEQYNYGVSLAYQLWIMWINMTDNKFRPNDLVTRAEFGTALSRMLYGITDWEESYYSTHLDRLYEEWIITNQNPNLQELRGYVMLMLMRSKK